LLTAAVTTEDRFAEHAVIYGADPVE
jgi:hypothetical protein